MSNPRSASAAPAPAPQKRFDELTFRGNLRSTRHGWLRLTPAYSVHLVREILDAEDVEGSVVLDPFCGTGTTALVCAERGLRADTTDINPFLCWLARTKTRRYTASQLTRFQELAGEIGLRLREKAPRSVWTPPLFQIEKWWPPAALAALGRAFAAIRALPSATPPALVDLLDLAFCQTLIARANVSFGHQSMSFRKNVEAARPTEQVRLVAESWAGTTAALAVAAASAIVRVPRIVSCDARELDRRLPSNRYGCVITSPPYPNRMSYIRELRPYMYWLGYLSDGKAAGELDWQAIGGTWGAATSLVGKWTPPDGAVIPFREFRGLLARIAEQSSVLSRYVHKYFHDMARHCEALVRVVAPGGSVHYVVGNSKFYDVVVPVERIFAALFAASGFEEVAIRTIRKRSSKRELYEYVVSARKPSSC